jgi:hypothetical protein
MPAAAPIQNNFTSGEFSGLMAGRVDFERYKTATKVLKNHYTFLQGGATRRPGTYFCDEAKYTGVPVRVVKFKYSTVSAFVLEFGHQYIRFKKNRAPIHMAGLSITGITQANPAVLTYTGTDPANGDMVDISGVAGMTQVNGRRFVVTNVNAGANTFELYNQDATAVDSSAYGAWTSGGNAEPVYTLATTYDEDDIFQLKFAQSADILYIWHPDYPERQLARVADNLWTLTSTTHLDGPYMAQNTTATTMTLGATSGNTTITASSIVGINGGTGFQTTDVGRVIRFLNTTWGYVRITARTSTTVCDVTVIQSPGAATAVTTWRMGLYSDTTGYPACGTFYGDRLYRGGCPAIPERFDGSNVGDYDNMAPTSAAAAVTDSHAVSFRLNSDDVQTIRWMKGTANGIAMGTHEGEWLVTPSTLNEAITPTNINAKQSTDWGSSDIQGIKAGQALCFVEAGGRRLREMNYLYYENVLQSIDMTVLAEHITKGAYDPAEHDAQASTVALSGLVEIDYAKKPIPMVVGPRKDGVLLTCTYSKDDKVMGWERQILGGYSDSGHTAPAKVKSACVIPASDGSYDEIWMVVERYINGRTVYYIEFLTAPWEQGSPQEDAYFVDCGLTYDGAAATTLTGLFHLRGETVQVLADGMLHADVTVSALGAITLTRAASVVHVGYTYNSDGSTLRNESGSATGTAQGKFQRISHVIFRVHDTLGLKVGPSFDALKAVNFRTNDIPLGDPTPLFTGDKEVAWPSGYSTQEEICWRYSDPLPGTLIAVMPQLVTQDR